MLWFNLVVGLILTFLCSKLIIIYYHTQKQRKIKIKPRIKLNHNIYIYTGTLSYILKLPDEVCASHTKRVGDNKKNYNLRRSQKCCSMIYPFKSIPHCWANNVGSC